MVGNRVTSSIILCLWLFCLSSSIFSFPVYAADGTFSFVEFNIAFVLGLSLPALLIAFKAKSSVKNSRPLFLLLTLASLVLLYCINDSLLRSEVVFLISSALILQLSCYWSIQLNNTKVDTDDIKQKLTGVLSYILILLLSMSVFLFGVVSADIAWLVFSSMQISHYVGSLLLVRDGNKQINWRTWPLLTMNIVFAITIYGWLTGNVSLNILAVIVVMTNLTVMISGFGHMLSGVIDTSVGLDKVNTKTGGVITDPATNLPSYQYALHVFDHHLKHQVLARYAAIVFKPTNFQQVNAVLGHHNSDILLLQLAYCLQKAIEFDNELLNFSTDESPVRLARLQGLHFLVVMDVAQSKHSDEIIIEQLCQKLAKAVPGPMSFKSFSSYFKLVFGVAFIGKDSNNVNEVISCAEDALQVADKEQNLVSFFAQDLAVFNQQQLQKMEQLKHDLLSDALEWRVQPQIKLKAKTILGFELLVTWPRKGYEKLDFNEIMQIAHQSGDAYTLCRQMIQQAFKFLKQLHDADYQLKVAIKVSRSCLLEQDLVDYIEQQALTYFVECQYLLVEIQEESLLSDAQEAKASIDQLKSLGVKIAIDEFSGSYEALRYLRRLAVSEIKINCQALAQTDAGFSDKAIINALINLTRKMELPLIGTQVNSIVIEEMFLAMGGEYAQGKHYSAGVSLQALPSWLESWLQQYP
jgi:EAL domain-containing protein (putative c-di-GMP-specific phosphodiesterase class I)/GGDEF domain-containing protein